MPENEFSSQNNGRSEDAAQNHKHPNALTADELTDALSDMWDAMDERNYDLHRWMHTWPNWRNENQSRQDLMSMRL